MSGREHDVPTLPLKLRMPIGMRDRFIEARKSLGLTQAQMADATNVPMDTIKNYEGGRRQPGAEAVVGYVRAGINSNWLLAGEGEMLLPAGHAQPLAEVAQAMISPATRAEMLSTEVPSLVLMRAAAIAAFTAYEELKFPSDKVADLQMAIYLALVKQLPSTPPAAPAAKL